MNDADRDDDWSVKRFLLIISGEIDTNCRRRD